MKTGDRETRLTLSEALKLSGLADSGGQAKHLIQEGLVRVNDQVETRRKRKLRSGDRVEVDGEIFVLD
jgi:ribosome-associated protein